MTITEFLLARIAEDEASAGSWYEDWGGNMEPLGDRIWAECKAKRQIVELHTPWGFEYSGGEACARCVSPDDWNVIALPDEERFPCATLRHLAAVYADHPDFDPAWRV